MAAQGLPKNDFYRALAGKIDEQIHAHYRIYPNNYIALDKLNGNNNNANHYTQEDKPRFEKYLAGQLAKIDLPDNDEEYLMERMLTMYANPLRNWLKVKGE